MKTQKLGRSTDKRMAMLRGMVTDLLWYGKIETTFDRAKAAGRLAEKYISLAIKTHTDVVTETKTTTDSKGKEKNVTVSKDGPKKLAARRVLMAKLYGKKEQRVKGEKKEAFKARTKSIKHPLIEKIFDDIAPKYAERKAEKNQGGGYVRVLKTTIRRGDNAQLAIAELVD